MNYQSHILTGLRNGLKVLAIVIFIITAVGNIYEAFMISSFSKIFRDVLHGAPLPLLSEIVLRCRVVLCIFAFTWLFIGVGALYIKNRMRLSTTLFTLAQAAILLQFGLTVVALILPLISDFISIQDASNASNR